MLSAPNLRQGANFVIQKTSAMNVKFCQFVRREVFWKRAAFVDLVIVNGDIANMKGTAHCPPLQVND